MKLSKFVAFEWDERKNEKNIAERSLDFADAQLLFDNPVVRRADLRQDYGEERFIAYGELKGQVVVIAYTLRKVDICRIISLRKAKRNERRAYYSWLQEHEKQD